jgi:chromate transporter
VNAARGDATPGLPAVAREWIRIGLTGFGGPPVHIALLRRLVIERHGWLSEPEFEAAVAACNLLPGPASTQLAIYCARRVGGVRGMLVGGLAFIVPAVVIVTALAAVFLASAPPRWIRGAGAGAGAAVAAVAAQAGWSLLTPSWGRADRVPGGRARWMAYVGLGVAAGWLAGPYVVLVLLACGAAELGLRGSVASAPSSPGPLATIALGIKVPLTAAVAAGGVGGVGALAWVALKVGALSYGGGFVIVPLMRGDAVHTYHWMTAGQFLSVVALGQVTPGPVVATVAAVGFAARGVGGAALASAIAFLPSFLFVAIGGPHLERLRDNRRAGAFLAGAGPAAVGAILGAAIPLAAGLREAWQFVVLGLAAVALLLARRGIVMTLMAAGTVGAIVGIAGGPLPR